MSKGTGSIIGVCFVALVIFPVLLWHLKQLLRIKRDVWEPHYQSEISRLKADLEYERERAAAWERIAIESTIVSDEDEE